LRPWVYSIASFLFARPYEQIQNDVCMHDLPVRLVANGGGYNYGVMGATHHALADYGAMLCLPHMHAFVPAFAADVPVIVERLASFPHPAYLRLGRCELPADFALPSYAPWRQLLRGDGATVLVAGPLAGSILDAARRLPASQRPNFWVVTELPIEPESIPVEFLHQLRQSGRLLVAEEHIAHGGVGQLLARLLLQLNVPLARFTHRSAAGYPSGSYGSQRFHRKESALDPESIIAELRT
jgi:transketolase